MTFTSVAIATTKFLFGMCDCVVISDIGPGDFALLLGNYTSVDTGTCDHTCLRAWTGIHGRQYSKLSNLSPHPQENQKLVPMVVWQSFLALMFLVS